MTGSPTGMPVAAAASLVISPRGWVGGISSGSQSRWIGTADHFQSRAPAQARAL